MIRTARTKLTFRPAFRRDWHSAVLLASYSRRCRPYAIAISERKYSEVTENTDRYERYQRNLVQPPKSEESSALDGCRHTDRVPFCIKDELRKRKSEWHQAAYIPIEVRHGEGYFCADGLLSHRRKAVKTAFRYKNGDIVVKIVATKICRGVIDVDHEFLGRQ